MARHASEAKRSEWLDRVSRQSSSGLSISAFCKQESVSESNFYFWVRRLKSTGASTSSSPKRHVSTRSPVTPRFVQIHPTSAVRSVPVEFVMANGTVIRVPSDQIAAVDVVAKAFAACSTDCGGCSDA
jgi:transposase-like protein